MFSPRVIAIVGIILAAAASRLIPHPWNVTPIAAMALFSGASLSDKRQAFLFPLAALLLGDIVIGFHRLIPFVYGSFALTVCLGFWLHRRRSIGRYTVAIIVSSMVLFALSNFGVWALLPTYPKTIEGLIACYVAALPYLRNALLGNAIYTMIVFGGFALAERRFFAPHAARS